MQAWIGTVAYFLAFAASVAIRAPHAHRSKAVPVAVARKGPLEIALLVAMALAILVLPGLHSATDVFGFADHALPPWAFAVGLACTAAWLWLFARSHADLGTNWSVTLELRERHELVSRGVYARVRHPMYAALFFEAFAQAFLVANWIAGPAMLVAFALLFALRLGPEERMMSERFGPAWTAYAARTPRLLPHVW